MIKVPVGEDKEEFSGIVAQVTRVTNTKVEVVHLKPHKRSDNNEAILAFPPAHLRIMSVAGANGGATPTGRVVGLGSLPGPPRRSTAPCLHYQDEQEALKTRNKADKIKTLQVKSLDLLRGKHWAGDRWNHTISWASMLLSLMITLIGFGFMTEGDSTSLCGVFLCEFWMVSQIFCVAKILRNKYMKDKAKDDVLEAARLFDSPVEMNVLVGIQSLLCFATILAFVCIQFNVHGSSWAFFVALAPFWLFAACWNVSKSIQDRHNADVFAKMEFGLPLVKEIQEDCNYGRPVHLFISVAMLLMSFVWTLIFTCMGKMGWRSGWEGFIIMLILFHMITCYCLQSKLDGQGQGWKWKAAFLLLCWAASFTMPWVTMWAWKMTPTAFQICLQLGAQIMISCSTLTLSKVFNDYKEWKALKGEYQLISGAWEHATV